MMNKLEKLTHSGLYTIYIPKSKSHNTFFYDMNEDKWYMDFSRSFEIKIPVEAEIYPQDYLSVSNLLAKLKLAERKIEILRKQRDQSFEEAHFIKWLTEYKSKNVEVSFADFLGVIAIYKHYTDSLFNKDHELNFITGNHRFGKQKEMEMLYEHYIQNKELYKDKE